VLVLMEGVRSKHPHSGKETSTSNMCFIRLPLCRKVKVSLIVYSLLSFILKCKRGVF